MTLCDSDTFRWHAPIEASIRGRRRLDLVYHGSREPTVDETVYGKLSARTKDRFDIFGQGFVPSARRWDRCTVSPDWPPSIQLTLACDPQPDDLERFAGR